MLRRDQLLERGLVLTPREARDLDEGAAFNVMVAFPTSQTPEDLKEMAARA